MEFTLDTLMFLTNNVDPGGHCFVPNVEMIACDDVLNVGTVASNSTTTAAASSNSTTADNATSDSSTTATSTSSDVNMVSAASNPFSFQAFISYGFLVHIFI